MSRSQQRGFTLIELMITVAIIAILAAIALPSYRQYIIRGNRAAAKSAMMDIANREQQFLLANRVYANKGTLTANGYVAPTEATNNYTWDVAVPDPDIATTVPSFRITFTPTGTQASDGDPLTLNSQGIKTPTAKWEK